MTMIAVGQGLRGLANRGMAAVARSESIENQQRMAIEAQEQAAESQLLGTGAGIGGMQGASTAMKLKGAHAGNVQRLSDAQGALSAATDASGPINNIGTAMEGIGKSGETVKTIMEGGELANTAGGINNISTAVEGVTATGEVLAGGAEVGGAINNLAGVTEAVATGGEAVAAAGEVAAASEAVAATGPMAQLSALATPIAIGLGVAFLLNKLFD